MKSERSPKQQAERMRNAAENLRRIEGVIAPFTKPPRKLTMNPPSGRWQLAAVCSLQEEVAPQRT